MRKLSKLKPKVSVLTDFYTLDIETGKKLSKHKGTNEHYTGTIEWELNGRPESFIFAVIYGFNYTRICWSIDEVKKVLLEPRFYKRKIFAHNGGGYDYNAIYDNIFFVDPKAIFNGKFISFSNGNCTFADSTNIFVGQSIAKIGKQIGKEKIGMSGGDYTNSDWSKPKQKARDINGCIRDCEILYDALIQYFEFAGDIKITQASLSLTYFQRFHLEHDIEYNENVEYFWDSYYGGRTEAFKIGPTNASVIDVNSMYSYIMRETLFPNPKFLKVEENVDTNYFLQNILPHFEGIVYATVSHKDVWLGGLPVRHKQKLLFPVGVFEGAWNFNEIRACISFGLVSIKRITRVVYSEPMQSPFIKFVDTGFAIKLDATIRGNKFEEDRIKRFLNSLYGKFGQRITEEYIYIDDVEKNIDLIRDYQKKKLLIKLDYFNADRNDAFLVVKSVVGKSISCSIPSFSSYITSGARVLILKKLLEMEKNRPIYCDTDSIFYEIDDGIESSKALGEWKKEDKIVTHIHGLKNYEYNYFDKDEGKQKHIHRIKGVPAKRVKTGENEFEYFNLIKTKESLRRGIDAGIQVKRTKKLKGTYNKRIVDKDGTTKPITLCSE